MEEGVARTALTDFVRVCINTSTWDAFGSTTLRMAYVGTSISNLAYLVNTVSSKWSTLHYPFPLIRPILPSKPHAGIPVIRAHSQVTHDLGAVPTRDVQDALVDAYFTKINPGFPVIDEAEFRRHYNNPRDTLPILVLQSVLLAGAHVCNHPRIVKSRSLVKVTLFRRAKALFDLHYENSRVHMVQAALLFTWHFEGADDASANAYYWGGVACRIAFGLGMHRDLSTSLMPLQEQRAYRRVWWIIYQLDVLSSLSLGRPLMINPDDCDVAPLNEDDFIEETGSLNPKIRVAYCARTISLCDIIVDVLKMHSPGILRRTTEKDVLEEMRKSLDSRLASWYVGLPVELSPMSHNRPNFWAIQLCMHYNTALLHLHRTPFISAPPLSERSIPRKSAEICSVAAFSIGRMVDTLTAEQYLQMCCFTCSTSILAAAIQTNLEIQFALSGQSLTLALQAQARLRGLFPAMRELSHYWPSADAILGLFQGLDAKHSESIEASLQLSRDTQRSSEIEDPNQDNAIPTHYLEDIFGLAGDRVVISDEDWREMATWLTLPSFQPPSTHSGIT